MSVDTKSAAEAAEAYEKGPGMPQLDLSTFPNQIFWLVVTLGVMYFVLVRIALPRISSVLAERQGTITSDIAAAEELKLQAAAAETAYNKALADARSEAQAIVAKTRDEIQADLDAAIAVADAEIAAKVAESEAAIAEIRDGAVDAVKVVAKSTAKAVVASMGFEADAKTLTAAVSARLKG